MARRGLHNPQIFWAVSLVPLLGAVAYLTLRPPIETDEKAPAEQVTSPAS